MKKLFTGVVALSAAIACCLPSVAANRGPNPNLSVGLYGGTCFPTPGVVEAESRNIVVNGRNEQVVHLRAASANVAGVAVHNAGVNALSYTMTGPIEFTVKRGNADWLRISVIYTAPGSSSVTGPINFVSPTTRLSTANTAPLVALGPGRYAIPLGGGGIPYGSNVSTLFINQNANPNRCNSTRCDFNQIYINKYAVGIDQGSFTCGTSCDDVIEQ